MATTYKDRLEGGYQLLRIRNFKAWTAALLIASTSGLVAVSLYTRGASAKPLYMPVDAFLPVLLIMVFIGTVFWMFFRSLEIRYAKKDSQRFLMVQTSITRWTSLIAVCVLLAVVLLVPVTRAAAAGSVTPPPETKTLVPSAEYSVSFENMDAFGIVRVMDLYVTLLEGGRVEFFVDRIEYPSQPEVRYQAQRIGDLRVVPVDGGTFYAYTVRFVNPTGQNVRFSWGLERVPMPELFGFVPGMSALFSMAGVGFVMYLRPRREQYERASIYSAEFRERIGSGEELYSQYHAPASPAPPARVAAAGMSASGRPVVAAAPIPGPKPLPVSIPPPRAVAQAPPSRLFVPGVTPAPVSQAPAPAVVPPSPAPPAAVPVAAPPPPPTPQEIFAEGARLYSTGNYAAAIGKFDAVLEREPRTSRALIAKGNALLKLGRTSDAALAYDRVLTFERANADAFRGTAEVYAAERKWRELVELADAYLTMAPGDPEMLERRGDAHLALGHRTEAQISYEAALLRKPGDPGLRGKIEKAKVDIAALQSRALLASASGDLEGALRLFDEVLGIEPENANALTGKAVALRRGGRIDEALESLNGVLARQPGHGGALLNKGRLLEERGDLDEALETYDKLLELNPQDPDAWVSQGDVLARMGRDPDAVRSYGEALRFSPGDEETRGKIRTLEAAASQAGELFKELFQIRGIGPAKAKALRDAGFHTLDDYRRASEDDFAAVRGIPRKLAQDLYRHFHPE